MVIPTRARPDLVTRAVRSALAQTYRDLEVVVVIDGVDENTPAALARIGDPRVRTVQLPHRTGAPNARNQGVRAARGTWTALLDDDDEWHPEKLATQMALAQATLARKTLAGKTLAGEARGSTIVASRLTMRTPRADLVLPRRLPEPGEPLSEYFTVRRGLFHGDGFIQTSTILAPTELLRRVPFAVGLPRLQELDWALRALEHDGVDLVFAAEPLVLWHADENRDRISSGSPWQEMLEWLRSSRTRMTARAYAALAMSVVSSMAATTRSPRVFRMLLSDARRNGRPGLIDYVTFLQIWLLPPQVRRKLRDLVKGRRRTPEQATSQQPVREPAGPVAGAAAQPAGLRQPAA